MTVPNRDHEPYLGIASDIPQIDPELDEFGYAEFSRLLAKAVLETPSPQGLVMAIHGPWGSGKSTVLNFIKYYLGRGEVDARPQVIEFNPWWFDDKKQLAAQFLAQLSIKLKLDPSNISKAGDLMAEYADTLGKAVAFSTGHAWIDVPVGAVLKLFKIKTKDVPALKKEIGAALQAKDRRYIIFIDDIDRLTPVEILEVFKVIKSLADFPNLVYVLSFDRDVVAKAITDPHRMNGDAYLEKIIQAPFSLPPVSKAKLDQKLFSSLNKIIENSDKELINQNYWSIVYRTGMSSLLVKPRDIIRYTNILSVTYPAVQDEVNIVDFFALELLRITLPQLYAIIRDNSQYFTGVSDQGVKSRGVEDAFHQSWLATIDQRVRDDVHAMLKHIFPRLTDRGHDSSYLISLRRFRRAASPEIFPLYFSFSAIPDSLSRAEILEFIKNLSERSKAEQTLLEALYQKRSDGSTKAKDYLTSLLDFGGELKSERASTLIQIVADIGDRLLLKSDETGGFFSSHPSWRLIDVIQLALNDIPKAERDAQLLAAFENGNSLVTLCSLVDRISIAKLENKRHGPGVVLSNMANETLIFLKQLAIDRIRFAAANNQLVNAPFLLLVLECWEEWTNIDEPKQWANDIINKESAPAFLSTFINGMGTTVTWDGSSRTEYKFDFKSLQKLIDLPTVASAVEAIDSTALNSASEQWAITTFKQQYPDFVRGR